MGRWGDGEIGRWGCIRYLPLIQSSNQCFTHFLSITSPENLFSGDTLRASIDYTKSGYHLSRFSNSSLTISPSPHLPKRILYKPDLILLF